MGGDLGKLMRSWRRAAGNLPAQELARALGKSRSTVFNWESGRERPDPIDIRRYGEALQVSEWAILHALDLRSRAPRDPSRETAA